MATAASCSPLDGKERFFRICRLLLDGGTDLLRREFDNIILPSDLPTVLQKEKSNLRKLPRSVLPNNMFQKLYPTPITHGKSTDFDISLLMVLFRHLCQLKAPPSSNNWGRMPTNTDESLEADILRLKIYRNTVIAHAETCCISNIDFGQICKDIFEIFDRRGGTHWKLKAEAMLQQPLTECETAYLKKLTEWYNYDIDVKDTVQQLDKKTDVVLKLTEKQDEKLDQLDNKTDGVLKLTEEHQGKITDVLRLTEKQDGKITDVLRLTKTQDGKINNMEGNIADISRILALHTLSGMFVFIRCCNSLCIKQNDVNLSKVA